MDDDGLMLNFASGGEAASGSGGGGGGSRGNRRPKQTAKKRGRAAIAARRNNHKGNSGSSSRNERSRDRSADHRSGNNDRIATTTTTTGNTTSTSTSTSTNSKGTLGAMGAKTTTTSQSDSSAQGSLKRPRSTADSQEPQIVLHTGRRVANKVRKIQQEAAAAAAAGVASTGLKASKAKKDGDDYEFEYENEQDVIRKMQNQAAIVANESSGPSSVMRIGRAQVASSLFPMARTSSEAKRAVISMDIVLKNAQLTLESLQRPNLATQFVLASDFVTLGLDTGLSRHLETKLSLQAPTPIQRVALPVLLDRETDDTNSNNIGPFCDHNVIIRAVTGSGKTLTYLLPILHRLAMASRSPHPRASRAVGTLAIIITPTRELAAQVAAVATRLVDGWGGARWVVPTVLAGGEKRKSEKARLRKGAAIVVGTPGRVLDHLTTTSSFDVAGVRWIVFDEADRLTELGFEDTATKIVGMIDERIAAAHKSRADKKAARIAREAALAAIKNSDSSKPDDYYNNSGYHHGSHYQNGGDGAAGNQPFSRDRYITNLKFRYRGSDDEDEDEDERNDKRRNNKKNSGNEDADHGESSTVSAAMVAAAATAWWDSQEQHLASAVPSHRVTVLVSATIPDAVLRLIQHVACPGSAAPVIAEVVAGTTVEAAASSSSSSSSSSALSSSSTLADKKEKSKSTAASKAAEKKESSSTSKRKDDADEEEDSEDDDEEHEKEMNKDADALDNDNDDEDRAENEANGSGKDEDKKNDTKKDRKKKGDEEFSVLQTPSKLQMMHALVPLKLRLVSLVGLLRSRIRPSQTGGSTGKAVVFMSCCDSVDFHFLLLGYAGATVPSEQSDSQDHADQSKKRKIFSHENGDDNDEGDGEKDDQKEEQDDDDGDTAEDGQHEGDREEKAKNTAERNGSDNKKGQKAQAKGLRVADQPISMASALLNGVQIFALHGNLPQSRRAATLAAFRACQSGGVLFATDVAARGLDLPGVTLSLQFDPPTDLREYVHRAGRTARAGDSGVAFLFLAPEEKDFLPVMSEAGLGGAKVEVDSLLEGLARTSQSRAPLKKIEVEDAATQAQNTMERWIMEDAQRLKLARLAYRSHIRAYAARPPAQRAFFSLRKLHLGHLAKAFALREAPSNMGKDSREDGAAVSSSSSSSSSSASKNKSSRPENKKRRLNPADEFAVSSGYSGPQIKRKKATKQNNKKK